ncbi:MAG TPA: glycoside hydrolase family 18 [Firmicutes bacterium]|jgi:spore germination protein YaaH|nr:glycoside hydrolase family 18 [Bacillota bacterium]HCF89814.1 glycoside hydrolase family 18 [Bacillota bacterium]HCF91306.1 glycoside hydrolase family 18 [Bacillota bacterium]
MQQTIWGTILALVLYLTSAISGGISSNKSNIPGSAPVAPPAISAPAGNTAKVQYGIITHDSVALRSSPSTASKAITTVSKGTALSIMGVSGEWYNVVLPSGTTGWIAKWLVKATDVPTNVKSGKTEVIGYYVEGYAGDRLSMNSLTAHSNTLTTVMPFFYAVDAKGNISGRHNNEPLEYARSKGLKVIASVHNISNSNFSGSVTHTLLSSGTNRRNAITNIEKLLKKHGYQGINIDFESVWPSDRPYLTQFFRELAWALRPKGYLVTAAFPAKTADSRTDKWSGAYDYAAITPYLDYVILMTYDEHYKSGPAGPVASQGWVRKVLQYATGVMPKNKIVMGLAGYGYEWSGKTGRALTFAQVESRVKNYGVTPRWSDSYQVPYFSYKKKGVPYTVWYENSHSVAAKMRLTQEFDLRGVALWRLGLEDPLVWPKIQTGLK